MSVHPGEHRKHRKELFPFSKTAIRLSVFRFHCSAVKIINSVAAVFINCIVGLYGVFAVIGYFRPINRSNVFSIGNNYRIQLRTADVYKGRAAEEIIFIRILTVI